MSRFKLIVLNIKEMKYKNIILPFIIITAIFSSSCERYYNPGLNIRIVKEDTVRIPEIEALLKYLGNSGDYINSKGVPNMVSVEDVYENLGNYYLVDLRSHKDYVKGHINGAVNIRTEEIIDYLEDYVSPSSYEKIIVICYTGQSASYVTGILRLMGYSNSYAMKYGMSAWNRTLDQWSSNISNKYANKLETKFNYKGKRTEFPQINTGAICGAEILESRAKTVLNTPFDRLKIDADRAFSDTSFFILNYWPQEKYERGHIPGAYQYTPKEDLKESAFLSTLPNDKKILVYCYTGQNAAFTIAYLRLLGYNAFTLDFGANSFMHTVLTTRKNWHGFVASSKLNDFPLITGEEPTDKKINVANTNGEKSKQKKKIIKRAKKEVEGGCG